MVDIILSSAYYVYVARSMISWFIIKINNLLYIITISPWSMIKLKAKLTCIDEIATTKRIPLRHKMDWWWKWSLRPGILLWIIAAFLAFGYTAFGQGKLFSLILF